MGAFMRIGLIFSFIGGITAMVMYPNPVVIISVIFGWLSIGAAFS